MAGWRNIWPCLLLLVFPAILAAQGDRLEQYRQTLHEMATEVPGLAQRVSLSVSGVPVREFVRGLAEAANLNIHVAPDLEVAVYTNFKSETAANVLLFLAKEYDLSLAFTGTIISVNRTDPNAVPRMPASIRASYRDEEKTLSLELENDSLVAAARAITRVSGTNVVVTNDLKDKLVTLYVQDMPVLQALEQLAFTNKVKVVPTSAGAYVLMPLAQNEENYIGKDATPGTRQTGAPQEEHAALRMVKLQNRSIDTIRAMIPATWKKGVELTEFREQNTLLLSGPAPQLDEIMRLVNELDTRVPMVLIEITMLDIRKGHTVRTGITAGVSDTVRTGGTLLSGVDYTLGARSVNKLLARIGSGGAFNLGRVMPDFYVTLSAMEDNNNVELRSVPKLSTLNGHVASMSIGNKRYYRLSTQNVMGSLNPQTVITEQFNEVNADMTIQIRPLVSGDEQVTLNINIDISDFTQDTPLDQPPPTTTSKFESIIRVRNEETVVLGGIERVESSDVASGLPGIARIPVLKWLFSNRTKGRSKVISVVFIKPTIIYQ